MNITPVVKQLLIINIIFFIGSQLVPVSYDLFSLFYPESEKFRFWQLLTHMFMHAKMPNLMHLVFNMFALYSFGSTLEHFWGGKKFLFFYISCGLGAAVLHMGVNYYEVHSLLGTISELKFTNAELHTLLNTDYREVFDANNQMVAGKVKDILERVNCNQEQFNQLQNVVMNYQSSAVGASGAVYGLLVAFAFMFPNAELALMFIPVPIKAKYFVPIYMMLYDGFFGILGNSLFGIQSGIAHFAHLGGALTGFIMMWYWKKNQFNKNRWN